MWDIIYSKKTFSFKNLCKYKYEQNNAGMGSIQNKIKKIHEWNTHST